jgi:hypothetical protein
MEATIKMVEYDRLSNKLILRIFGDEMAYNKLSQIANYPCGITNVKTIIENGSDYEANIKVWFNNQFVFEKQDANLETSTLVKTLDALEYTLKQACRECKCSLAKARSKPIPGEDGWQYCDWRCKRLWFLRPAENGILMACSKCGDQIDCSDCDDSELKAPLVCEECFEYDIYVKTSPTNNKNKSINVF